MIKLKTVGTIRMKFLVISIIIFSLFTTYFYEFVNYEVFSLRKRDASLIQWYTNNTINKNVIITEFGWSHVFRYYNYPFANKNEALLYKDEEYFIFLKYYIDLFPPNNHIDEYGKNVLQEIKKNENTDVYMIFADDYIINKGFELFGQLSDKELEEYYRLDYLNKICSSKTLSGAETPLYWVI